MDYFFNYWIGVIKDEFEALWYLLVVVAMLVFGAVISDMVDSFVRKLWKND